MRHATVLNSNKFSYSVKSALTTRAVVKAAQQQLTSSLRRHTNNHTTDKSSLSCNAWSDVS